MRNGRVSQVNITFHTSMRVIHYIYTVYTCIQLAVLTQHLKQDHITNAQPEPSETIALVLVKANAHFSTCYGLHIDALSLRALRAR